MLQAQKKDNMVRTYLASNARGFDEDVGPLREQGWIVVSVSQRPATGECMRWFPLFWMVPPQELVVTYRKS